MIPPYYIGDITTSSHGLHVQTVTEAVCCEATLLAIVVSVLLLCISKKKIQSWQQVSDLE